LAHAMGGDRGLEILNFEFLILDFEWEEEEIG